MSSIHHLYNKKQTKTKSTILGKNEKQGSATARDFGITENKCTYKVGQGSLVKSVIHVDPERIARSGPNAGQRARYLKYVLSLSCRRR